MVESTMTTTLETATECESKPNTKIIRNKTTMLDVFVSFSAAVRNADSRFVSFRFIIILQLQSRLSSNI